MQNLTVQSFLNLVNHIKRDMNVAENVQFILQEDLSNTAVIDVNHRVLRAKLRVVTLHDMNTDKVISTSCYGVYGGKNAYLGYVGDPLVYIEAAKAAGFCNDVNFESIEQAIQDAAMQCHSMLEKSTSSFFGEVVTDIIIGTTGIVPLKANIKPERLNMEFIAQQTHYGTYLEGDDNERQAFLSKLAEQEGNRTNVILENILYLNEQRNEKLMPSELSNDLSQSSVETLIAVN